MDSKENVPRSMWVGYASQGRELEIPSIKPRFCAFVRSLPLLPPPPHPYRSVSFLGGLGAYLTTCTTPVHGPQSSHPLYPSITSHPLPEVPLLVIPCPPPMGPHPLLDIMCFVWIYLASRYARETRAIVGKEDLQASLTRDNCSAAVQHHVRGERSRGVAPSAPGTSTGATNPISRCLVD